MLIEYSVFAVVILALAIALYIYGSLESGHRFAAKLVVTNGAAAVPRSSTA